MAERERLTAALEESEQRLRALAENVPQMIWVADAGANFQYLSPKWLEYTGTTVEQNANGGWAKAIHPDDRARSVEAWTVAAAQRAVYESEYRIRRHDGDYRWHLARAVPLADPHSNRDLWFGTTTDIHDQKHAQEALIRSEKLASVGRMAATVAHEINNPLELITNSVYIASLDTNLSEQARESLATAEQELERVAHLTRQTLGFYRENTAPTEVDIQQLVDGVVELYAPKLAYRDINVQTDRRRNLRIKAVAGEIRQVVSNIIANAIDASRGGRLRIRTSRVLINGSYRVRMTFGDTGEGVAPENLNHLFEPFFTTKETVGTGLGLWVSKEIVSRHGGSIRVRSRVGQGTVFSVFLPETASKQQERQSEEVIGATGPDSR